MRYDKNGHPTAVFRMIRVERSDGCYKTLQKQTLAGIKPGHHVGLRGLNWNAAVLQLLADFLIDFLADFRPQAWPSCMLCCTSSG